MEALLFRLLGIAGNMGENTSPSGILTALAVAIIDNCPFGSTKNFVEKNLLDHSLKHLLKK